jgi:hypothetical protein
MTATVRAMRRKAARKPAPRLVDVIVKDGDFEGWEATARADFPARVLADLQSGSIERIMTALDVIVTEHNFPDAEGEIAASMAEVDPYDGLLRIAGDIFDAIGKLPNR